MKRPDQSGIEFHPLANLFPLMHGAEFDELVADIGAQGLREPIVRHEDQILDGRNRYRACLAAGVDPTFTLFREDDPVAFVISANLRRRHLDESQRAIVAAKLATLGHGGDRSKSPIGDLKQADAAALLNVGKRSVERAREVLDHGDTELVGAVERGDVSVSAAADVSELPKEQQRELVARGEKEILEAAKAIRTEKSKERYAARIDRIAKISVGNTALTSDRRYPVILADPPWDYRVFNEKSGSARAAANHYPTMKLDEIWKLPVGDIAAEDAILFMWTTAPNLEDSFTVLEAWGFEYKTHAVWVKHAQGLGFFLRGQHEILVIATRGDIPCPLPENRPSSVIDARRREHSRKPDEAYALIEGMYPDLPKIELFARQKRGGWQAWGNQAVDVDDIPPFLDRTSGGVP
jgi:N6-adenosine-specific RNA methylase IME4